MANFYTVLGIPPLADEKEIRAAYRKLAKQYHPDAGAGSSAEKFRAVQAAYDLLSDPEKRRDYDRGRQTESFGRSAFSSSRYASRSVHIDLRDLTGSSRGSARTGAEPLRTRSGWVDVDDEWDRLIDYLLRDFGF